MGRELNKIPNPKIPKWEQAPLVVACCNCRQNAQKVIQSP